MVNQTIQFYDQHAEQFINETMSANMTNAQRRFLNCLPHHALILDFGCGSGRDTKAFLDAGYLVEATDGSQMICDRASVLTGIPVKRMLFNELDAKDSYEGIWACASILHLNRKELADVLQRIEKALKPSGVLYTSFKYGTYEGFCNGRYFTNFTNESIKEFWVKATGMHILDTWITQDVCSGREEEKWINILAQRV